MFYEFPTHFRSRKFTPMSSAASYHFDSVSRSLDPHSISLSVFRPKLLHKWQKESSKQFTEQSVPKECTAVINIIILLLLLIKKYLS